MKIKVETEKKYYCLEPEKLIELALNLNFKQMKKIKETDEYFTDIDSNFIKKVYPDISKPPQYFIYKF